MKIRLLFALILTLTLFKAQSQFLDSLKNDFHHGGTFDFSFNSRNSYIGNSSANIFGFMAGLCYGNKYVLGAGYNTLSSTIFKNTYENGESVKTKLDFSFASVFAEYKLGILKHWRVDASLSLGAGSYYFSKTLNSNIIAQNNIIAQGSRFILPVEPEVEVDYNFNRFCGLYVQGGYRLMLINNNLANENFNSVTYSLGVLMYPLEIYKALFPRTKEAKKIQN